MQGAGWHILGCCSSAKRARRLLVRATVPCVRYLGICRILSDRLLSNMSRRDAVGWLPAKQVAAQPIPGRVSRQSDRATYACFDVALFSVTGARCRRGPLLLVWSAVSSMLPHKLPLRGGNDGIGRTTPPTTHRIPVPVRSPAPLVSGAAAALGRSSSAPDETVCLASRLANWACDAVSAKNSNSYQLATRRLVEETEAHARHAGGK